MKRRMVFVFLLSALLLASCFTAQALEPPYGSGIFYSEQEMIASLRAYIDDFPNGHPHSSDFVRVNTEFNHYHLEKRQVILPRLTGFELESCSYADSYWDSGVNYCHFSFENAEEAIHLFIYYHMRAKDMPNSIDSLKRQYSKLKTIQEGNYNGMYYYAYREKDTGRNLYDLIIGDALVTVYDSQPFQESRIDLIHYEKTGLMLPVFVFDDDYVISTTSVIEETTEEIVTGTSGFFEETAPAQPEPVTDEEVAASPSGSAMTGVWICCGISIALVGFAGCVIWRRKENRPHKNSISN